MKFFNKILVFLRKLPIFRNILAFIDIGLFFVFHKEFQDMFGGKLSRFDKLLFWFITNIMVNGFLWTVVLVFVFKFEFDMTTVIGVGLLRYVFLDFFNDTVLSAIRTARRK